MGLLDQLWDDTVAGPRPENGLGKLRKYPSLKQNSGKAAETDSGNGRSVGDELSDEAMRVTRSIMIIKPPGNPTVNGSPPVSPAGSTPPVSPFFGGGGRETNSRFRRRSTSDSYDQRAARETGPRSPRPPYDL